MKLLLLAFWITWNSLALDADPMCVRNYAKQGGGGVCTTFPLSYTQVQHLTEKDTEVCTRIYSDFYCETSKEYEFIVTKSGEKICALNYNQPPIANFCESVPQFYDYIQKNPLEWE